MALQEGLSGAASGASAGSMFGPVGAAIGGGIGFLGGLLGGNSAEDAARAQADATLKAAQLAAEEARFRPVGVTTRFGGSQFQYDPSGRVSGASYNVSPELQAYQDRFRGMAGGALSQAEMAGQQYAPLTGAASSLYGLGQQYLQQTPEQVAQQYMARQQDLLAPSRERQMAQLQNQLFQQGRGGLSVGATGIRPSGAAGLGATTPEMEAYYNALAQQDLQLANQAQTAGQEQLKFGAGLFGVGSDLLNQYQQGQVGALRPFEAYFGQEKAIEGVGQQPLDIGMNIGAKGMSPTAANAILAGGTTAAQLRGQADAYNPLATALIQGSQNPQLMNAFGNLFSGGGGVPSGAAGYGISPQQFGDYYGYL
jgi:hypothetical protein